MLGLNLCGSLGFSLMLTTLEPQERTKGKGIAPAYLSPPPVFLRKGKSFLLPPPTSIFLAKKILLTGHFVTCSPSPAVKKAGRAWI